MSDAIFVTAKAAGRLTIGDKKEIDRATWRKPRGMPPEKGPLTLKSDGNRPVRPDGWEQIDKPELSENETSGKPMSVVLTDAIALGRPWFNCTSLNRPGVALADVRFGAHSGLKSDIAPSPKSANNGSGQPFDGNLFSTADSDAKNGAPPPSTLKIQDRV